MNADEDKMRLPSGLTRPEYFVGLDLGQRVDFTAIAVVERTEAPAGGWEWAKVARWEPEMERRLTVRWLERVKLGTPYPAIVARVRAVVRDPCLEGRCTLVADGTGLGGPVLEMLRAAELGCRVMAVTITGGAEASAGPTGARVPKRDLILGLRVAFESGEMRIARGVREGGRLVEELTNMRSRVTGPGRETFGAAKQGVHDDLALAVALACWAGRRGKVGEVGLRLNY